MSHANVSAELIWAIVNGNNSQLVKRKQAGGVQFSRDPLNLLNKHSFKYEGFVSDKAVGVGHLESKVTFARKRPGQANHPAKSVASTGFGKHTSSRKISAAVAAGTAKGHYRPDLRGAAVGRASAIKYSLKPKKETPAPKLRGAKARKAAA